MGIQHVNNIDFCNNQALNMRLQNLATDPANPLDGLVYYNSTSGTVRYYGMNGWCFLGHLGEVFTEDMLSKLNAIADGANLYVHPAYTPKASGMYKVTVDATGHVSAATAVAKADITALGIPAQDTTYAVATTSTNGLMSNTDKTKIDASYTSAQADTAIATAISNLINSAPAALNTLDELAAALGDDASFATTITNALANKVDKVAGKQLSTEDFTSTLLAKLNGIATGANAYTHPTGDGNSHVPLTGTTNNAKVLKSGATANSASWGSVAYSEITGTPTNLAKKYSVAVGTGAATSIVVTHNLNSQDVIVTLRETASPFNVVLTDVQITSVNTITLIFATAPASGQYTVTVVG